MEYCSSSLITTRKSMDSSSNTRSRPLPELPVRLLSDSRTMAYQHAAESSIFPHIHQYRYDDVETQHTGGRRSLSSRSHEHGASITVTPLSSGFGMNEKARPDGHIAVASAAARTRRPAGSLDDGPLPTVLIALSIVW